MAWESRHGTHHKYLYEHRRVDGRVVKSYLGTGPGAVLSELTIVEERRRIAENRRREAELRTRLNQLDRHVLGRLRSLRRRLSGELLALGFHIVKGTWKVPLDRR